MINYSIIIPHRNTPSLLVRCLKSLPMREDMEIIVVDDNSSEDIVDFEHFPGYDMPIVKILFTKEGRGAGYARNCGVKIAQGRWLVFADADDYFTPLMDSILCKYVKDEAYDMVFLNAKRINDNGDEWRICQNTYIENFLKRRIWSEKVLRYGFWTPWSRMVKRKIVIDNNILFDELPVGNDMMFVLNATKMSSRVTAERDVVYMYYSPMQGSQTYKKYNEKKKSRLELKLRQRDFYNSVNYPFFVPIFRDYNVFADSSIKPMLKKYRYRLCQDLLSVFFYAFGKLIKAI